MGHRLTKRGVALIVFALLILMMSWDSTRMNAAVVEGTIPQESIRLRILANSDSPRDQAVKRQVRDALVNQMKAWAQGPMTLEQARAIIASRMPELSERIQRVLDASGADYGHQVELGIVPFPTKMYGGQVYPAGDYEALRVTLGKGDGQNWWCVLFPPLCFVDGVTGDAVSAKSEKSVKTAAIEETDEDKPAETEFRFFLWDWIVSIFT